ncbi:MAG TPA: HIT family protein [Candidatus Saccharimonadales bacterium]|nr:HIT family protein [Candidatus Saccharimonadales bacterium]
MKDIYDPEVQKNARKSAWYDEVNRNVTKCPFCDLKEKYLIAEKDGVVLTVNLFPYIDGHMMIIPRRHVESLDKLNKKEWQAMHDLISDGIKLVNTELKVENTNTLYREGAKSGISLKHLHIHIIPITTEFLHYEPENKRFVMAFQDIELTPVEMAAKLRKAWKKSHKNK